VDVLPHPLRLAVLPLSPHIHEVVVITHMAPPLAWYLNKMSQMQTIFFLRFSGDYPYPKATT
jgi:hypothetical protein